jgi:hypothetical protein
MAIVLAACGGGSDSSGTATTAHAAYSWRLSSADIEKLIGEIEPYEVMPGCNPGRSEQEELAELITAREQGHPDKPYEIEYAKSEKEGTLLGTAAEEEEACIQLARAKVKAEADQIRTGQELEAEEAAREEKAREAARERQQTLEAEEAAEAESPNEQANREFWERTEEEAEAQPPQKVKHLSPAEQREIDERFVEEGGDGPG